MAATKKSSIKATDTKAGEPVKKIEAAAPAKALEAKAEAPEAEEKVVKAEEIKAEVKTATAAKKVSESAVAAEPEKKKRGRKPKTVVEKQAEDTVKKAEPVKKVKAESVKEVKAEPVTAAEPEVRMSIQFAGKSYNNVELVKIAKDVWKYDLDKDVNDIRTIDLYVKPEENKVYFVVNGTEEGSFCI